MHRDTLRLLSLPVAATFILAGCLAVAPYETRTDRYVERVAPAPPGGFGYLSIGAIARADFFGNVDGLEPGTGGTVTFPLSEGVLAVAAVTVLLVAAAVAAEGELDLSGLGGPSREGTWDSGISDPSRVVISECSFDFTMSRTWHEDKLFGGQLDYFAFLLGMRLGGPRRYVPRYYFSGGYGFYSFGYDNRPDARVTGPYVGGGLEVFADPGMTLGLDYKVHYYFGDDEEGDPVDGACGQLSANITWYW